MTTAVVDIRASSSILTRSRGSSRRVTVSGSDAVPALAVPVGPRCSRTELTAWSLMIQTRNLEIDLFWKRSLFFWGFISAAFVGYTALRQSELRTVLACFGTVCSCAWTLVNRGSKYWQE